MKSTDKPDRITKPFAVNGPKNTIAVNSSPTSESNGVATFEKGFPSITMQPLSAGGIPPSGKDMNGILYDISSQQQWQNAGLQYGFDADFATAISGYPKGAAVLSSDQTGYWINTVEDNQVSPEGEGENRSLTGWVPGSFYGNAAVTINTADRWLTDLEAAKPRIVLTGTLTANRNLYFPKWVKNWTIENKCTGAFTVILRTDGSGSTITSIPGSVLNIHCNGTSDITVGALQADANAVSATKLLVRDNTRIEAGNDGAGFTDNNMLLKSWYGIGFYCTQPSREGLAGYIDTRINLLEMKGKIVPGDYENFDARFLGIHAQADSAASADTATKLTTARKIAGHDFDGTADISISAGDVDAYSTTETDARYNLKNTSSFTGNSGWHKDNSSGLIIQWGIATRTSDDTLVFFPVNFPNACLNVQLTLQYVDGFHDQNIYAYSLTSPSFYLKAGSGERIVYYVAIGY